MKVFVSWSGELSQKFAGALKEWLEQCIQSVEVFFSSEDIEKGDNWQLKLSNELQDTNYGIVCLTHENIDSPWIHFEAGALSKMLASKVMVLAMNINFSDIKGPLKAFQATKFEHDDILKLIRVINGLQEKPLSDEKLKNSFEAFWPQFSAQIDQIRKDHISFEDAQKISKINVSDAVDEILQLVRTQSSLLNNPEKMLPAEYLEYVFKKKGLYNSDEKILEEIYSFSKYILEEHYQTEYREMGFFWENYYMMLKKISADHPLWRRKYSQLLTRIKNRSNTADVILGA